jgi:hypothetical protein
MGAVEVQLMLVALQLSSEGVVAVTIVIIILLIWALWD